MLRASMRKFIFSGPVGAGKTTAIRTITNDKILHTDVKTSDSVAMRKDTTTVAMDFGMVKLSNDETVHVYGTPGQERFDFMWDILAKNANGLVLLMDNSRTYPYRDLTYYIDAFKDLIDSTPFIIAITRLETADSPTLENYQYWLKQLNISASVIAIDTREYSDVLMTLEYLAGLISLPKDTTLNRNDVLSSKQLPSEQTLNADHTFKAIDHLLDIKGVEGIGLNDAYGEVLQANYKDRDFEQISAFLAGLADSMNANQQLGKIKQITIRSPIENSLHLYLDKEQTLSLETSKKLTITALNQQVEDILQWS